MRRRHPSRRPCPRLTPAPRCSNTWRSFGRRWWRGLRKVAPRMMAVPAPVPAPARPPAPAPWIQSCNPSYPATWPAAATLRGTWFASWTSTGSWQRLLVPPSTWQRRTQMPTAASPQPCMPRHVGMAALRSDAADRRTAAGGACLAAALVDDAAVGSPARRRHPPDPWWNLWTTRLSRGRDMGLWAWMMRVGGVRTNPPGNSTVRVCMCVCMSTRKDTQPRVVSNETNQACWSPRLYIIRHQPPARAHTDTQTPHGLLQRQHERPDLHRAKRDGCWRPSGEDDWGLGHDTIGGVPRELLDVTQRLVR